MFLPSPFVSRSLSRSRDPRRPGSAISVALLLGVSLLLLLAAFETAGVEPGQIQAPTKLHHQPSVADVVALPGDFVTMRYSVGHLDRAARLQFRLDPQMRAYQRWVDLKIDVTTFVLSEAHWRQSRINMPFGVPVRIGRVGLAAPADPGDEALRLWAGLGLSLPSPTPSTDVMRGTPQGSVALAMADLVSQIQLAEIVVDQARLAGNKHWLRGLTTHVLLVRYLDKHDEEGLRELDIFYRQVLGERPRKALAASDYRPVIELGDWLWFQARFHQGAKVLLEEEGRGLVKKLQKLRERNGGVLTASSVLDRYDDLSTWYYDGFAAVSTRPASR